LIYDSIIWQTVDDNKWLFLYWVFVEKMSVGKIFFDQNKPNQNEEQHYLFV
jgi:hypothetical protein